MKKLDLGQTITIFANVGVIAGIVFLAVELRQNNELMAAAARDAQNVRFQEFIQHAYMVPGLAEIIVKVRNEESLTEVETAMLRARQGRQLSGFQAQWREFNEGAAESPRPENLRRTFYEGSYYAPPLHDAWEDVKLTLNPAFIEWFEAEVMSE